MNEKKATKLDRDQRKYLQEQLRYSRHEGSFAEPKEPAAVKQARKVVEGWDKHVAALRRSHDAKRAKAHSEAMRMLNFGTPEQALAAVDAYKTAL